MLPAMTTLSGPRVLGQSGDAIAEQNLNTVKEPPLASDSGSASKCERYGPYKALAKSTVACPIASTTQSDGLKTDA